VLVCLFLASAAAAKGRRFGPSMFSRMAPLGEMVFNEGLLYGHFNGDTGTL